MLVTRPTAPRGDRRRRCSLLLLAVGAVATLVGCGGDESGTSDGASEAGAAADATRTALVQSAGALTCPRSEGQQPDVTAALSGLEGVATMDGFLLSSAAEEVSDDVADVYCLQVEVLEQMDLPPTELTFSAPASGADYGVSHSTSDAQGSEEITYSPFVVSVVGSCRTITASMALVDGTRHEASVLIGRRCAAG